MKRALLLAAATLMACLTVGERAIANNLKGQPRHACHGVACGQGNTLPPCRGGHRTSNGTVIQCK
jgi:hypothetical protein